jgi:hypothetical protein
MPDPKTTTPIDNDLHFEFTVPGAVDPALIQDFRAKLADFVKVQTIGNIDAAAKFSQISHNQEALLGQDLIRLAQSYGMKTKQGL